VSSTKYVNMANCCPCCENTLELGCFEPCELVFDTGQTAGIGEDGEYTIVLRFGRRNTRVYNDISVGQPIRFQLPALNENYTYIAQILDPNGDVWLSGIYDCFKFTTIIGGDSEIILP